MLTLYLTPEQVDILDAMLEVLSDGNVFMRLNTPKSDREYAELFHKVRAVSGRQQV